MCIALQFVAPARLGRGDRVPLPELHRGAPGGVSQAHHFLRDCQRTGLRLLSGLRTAEGRAVRRLHAEMRERFEVLPECEFRVTTATADTGTRTMRQQSGPGAHHDQPGVRTQW